MYFCISSKYSQVFTVGTAIDHILEFRKIRDSRLVREAMETNRLVVRVEKVGVGVEGVVIERSYIHSFSTAVQAPTRWAISKA